MNGNFLFLIMMIYLTMMGIRGGSDCVEPNQAINLSGLASHWIAAHCFVPAATADDTDGFAFYYLPCSPVPTLKCDFPNAAGMCQTEFGESQWSCGLESSAELICDKNSVTVLKFFRWNWRAICHHSVHLLIHLLAWVIFRTSVDLLCLFNLMIFIIIIIIIIIIVIIIILI